MSSQTVSRLRIYIIAWILNSFWNSSQLIPGSLGVFFVPRKYFLEIKSTEKSKISGFRKSQKKMIFRSIFLNFFFGWPSWGCSLPLGWVGMSSQTVSRLRIYIIAWILNSFWNSSQLIPGSLGVFFVSRKYFLEIKSTEKSKISGFRKSQKNRFFDRFFSIFFSADRVEGARYPWDELGWVLKPCLDCVFIL